MRFGAHPYIWSTSFDNNTLDIIANIRELGFDAIEIPMRLMNELSPRLLRERLEKSGLDAVCSATIRMETDITSSDSAMRKNGMEYLKKCLNFAAETEAELLTGVLYSPFRKNIVQAPDKTEWDYAVEGIRKICDLALRYEISLGIEPLNRYETYLINTARQGLDFIDQTGAENLKLHLDTYHMNIEEKSIYKAMISAGDKLGYLHIAENDRGLLGKGHIPWNDIFSALREIHFSGIAALETFVFDSSPVSFSTCTWRKLFGSSDQMAIEGLKFLKEHLAINQPVSMRSGFMVKR